MSTPLSREQVELLKPLATYDAQTVRFDSSQGGYVGVYTALAMMIATDAALRQQLATMTQQYKDAADERSSIIESDNLYKFVACERDALARQLATAREELDKETAIVNRVWKALGVTTYEQAEGKTIEQLVSSLREALARVTQERDNIASVVATLEDELDARRASIVELKQQLTAQLAASQVRIKELEARP